MGYCTLLVGTLPETNSSPLQMDGWNTTFLLGRPIFRGYVSFREGSSINSICSAVENALVTSSTEGLTINASHTNPKK